MGYSQGHKIYNYKIDIQNNTPHIKKNSLRYPNANSEILINEKQYDQFLWKFAGNIIDIYNLEIIQEEWVKIKMKKDQFLKNSTHETLQIKSSIEMGCPIIKSNKISGSLLVTNGEGYKSTSSDNNEKISFQALYGEERLDKKDGFNIGTVFSTLAYETDAVEATGVSYTPIWDDENSSWDVEITEAEPAILSEDKTTTVIGGFAGFSSFGARVGLEYHMGTDLDNEYKKINGDKIRYGSSSTLMSFYANYSLPFVNGLSVMGRYDMLDLGNEDDDITADINESTEDNVATITAGLVYNCTDGFTVAPHIVQTTEGTEDGPMMDFNLSFQFKF